MAHATVFPPPRTFAADDVNLLADNIDSIKKNTETLIDANKEVGVEVNSENQLYVSVS
jgi:hypothetical protein